MEGLAHGDVFPLPRARPPRVVAPRHARPARAQVAESAAEQQHAPEYTQDIEDRKARGCRDGLLLDSGFELGFLVLAHGVARGWRCRGLAVTGGGGHGGDFRRIPVEAGVIQFINLQFLPELLVLAQSCMEWCSVGYAYGLCARLQDPRCVLRLTSNLGCTGFLNFAPSGDVARRRKGSARVVGADVY
jgi:hypothetical protein